MARPPLRATSVALLCALVVLAGCSTLSPGSDAPSRVAPGVTAERVANASALAAAHERVLRRGSITVNRVYVQRVARGNYTYRVAHNETVRIGPDWERFAYVDHVTGPGRAGPFDYTQAAYGNGSVVVTRYANATTERYRQYDAARSDLGPWNLTYTYHLRGLEGGRVVGTTGASDGGPTLYRVRATRTQSRQTPGGNLTSNQTAEALVEPSGFVRNVDGRVTGSRPAGHVDVQFHVEWVQRNETAVGRPEWVDAARNASA